ncbi:MAG: hypothetical protein ACM3XO_21025 [Bacteroidota bacterium]
MRRGLTLGKFAPLHSGHQHVIETTPVPLRVRANWLRMLYPQIKVIEAWDGPTEVGDTPGIKRIHEDYILKTLNISEISHFYSSEFYGDQQNGR